MCVRLHNRAAERTGARGRRRCVHILRLKFWYAETRPVVCEFKGRFVSNLAKETPPDGGS